MRPFSTFGRQRPFAAALTVLALTMGWFIMPLLLRGPVDVTNGTGVVDMTNLRPFIINEAILVVLLGLIVALLRWGRATGVAGPVDPAGMRLALLILVPPVSIVAMTWASYLSLEGGAALRAALVPIATLALLVGLFEELLFRGVLLHGLQSRISAGWAIVASGTIFGLFHGVNALAGQDLTITAIQIAGAAGLGLFFGAVTVQARSIWPAVALHALWDAFALSAPAAFDLLPQSDTMAAPQPGPQALILPALLSLAAWIIHRRWCKRMGRAASNQIDSN
ncbi:CPBP family intramembrane glutamic endopeptidase [Loktanella sp. R86503]|uniref:CPBP family intramembrane glutamic endopeptidase n=1 Tax=Loktanella sp. R86503 TaxID=3093847 RepID=UPI0036DB38DF